MQWAERSKWNELNWTELPVSSLCTVLATQLKWHFQFISRGVHPSQHQEATFPPTRMPSPWFLLLCWIHFLWLFQNKINRFAWLICSREIPMSVSIACNHTKNKSGGTYLKAEVQIIYEWREQEKFWTIVRSLCTTVHIFGIFVNFCTLVLFNSLT